MKRLTLPDDIALPHGRLIITRKSVEKLIDWLNELANSLTETQDQLGNVKHQSDENLEILNQHTQQISQLATAIEEVITNET